MTQKNEKSSLGHNWCWSGEIHTQKNNQKNTYQDLAVTVCAGRKSRIRWTEKMKYTEPILVWLRQHKRPAKFNRSSCFNEVARHANIVLMGTTENKLGKLNQATIETPADFLNRATWQHDTSAALLAIYQINI